MVCDQFDTLYAEGATQGRVMTIPLHPFVIGLAFRIKYLDQALQYICAHDGVWKATRMPRSPIIIMPTTIRKREDAKMKTKSFAGGLCLLFLAVFSPAGFSADRAVDRATCRARWSSCPTMPPPTRAFSRKRESKATWC